MAASGSPAERVAAVTGGSRGIGRAVVEALLAERWRVRFSSRSEASVEAFAGGAAYNASKYGLLGLSDAAMLDLRPHGIRVCAILPGSVDTDFGSGGDGSWKLAPEDVARAVVDLLRYPDRALPSRLELRPTRPPRR